MFFAEVWLLCAVAFLLGSAVTWLVFVVPLRRRADRARPLERPPARAPAADPGPPPLPAPAAPLPPPAADPALAALEGTAGPVAMPSPGRQATGALDLLGVAGTPDGPAIPQQPGPRDGREL